MSENIDNARTELDAVDTAILRALGDRQEIVARIASLKTGLSTPLQDTSREQELLYRLARRAGQLGLDHGMVRRVFREILDHSLRCQVEALRAVPAAAGEITVGYQGGDGAYSQVAADHHFSGRQAKIRTAGYPSFRALLEDVESGALDYALLPIENTTAGSINEAYDLLGRTRLAAVGEQVLRVDHCLAALEPMPTGQLRRVASHPQALAQCSEFLGTLHNCDVISFSDTALAVEKVRADGDRRQGAIASVEAAVRHGLAVIKRGIANQAENYTRFLVIGRQPIAVDGRVPCKTSVVLTTRHEQGALGACLTILAEHGLNLTKLESRPRPNTPWEYLFYLDFEGNVADTAVRDALRRLAAHVTSIRLLGSYPTCGSRYRAPGNGDAHTNGNGDANGNGSDRGGAANGNGTAPEAARVNGNATPSQAARVNGDGTATAGRAPTPASLPRSVLELLATKPYKMVARTQRQTDSIVHVGDVAFGGPEPVLIAGPCSVESREQIVACARAVAESGGHVLRGGCYKPRTSPYSFQGLGDDGLLMLAETGRYFGLPVVTEVLCPADADRVAEHADILQVGARNVQNFALLRAVGATQRPVLLKRGMMSSIDEWLAAAEYILAAGNQQVILCERGIRTFETATRNTLDLTVIPVVRERTHLPVIVDPSHACGVWRWVTPMVRAAVGAGAQGVMVEIHPRPEEALSDGPQSLMFDKFAELADAFRAASR